jgi:hypothetical protein
MLRPKQKIYLDIQKYEVEFFNSKHRFIISEEFFLLYYVSLKQNSQIVWEGERRNKTQ